MGRNAIQEIVRDFPTNELKPAPHQSKALRCIECCRTGKLGVTKVVCNDCGNEWYFYKSCGNRNCPGCNSLKQLRWKESRMSEQLNVPYYHAVFTVPAELNTFFLNHQRDCYDLLFRTVSETLLTLAADKEKQKLNAQIGFICVLHTWGSTLSYHPHIHVILPGCGLTKDNKLVQPTGKFLFPVKVMSSLFRGKFLAGLKKLKIDQKSVPYNELYGKPWVVYLKDSMPGSSHVVEYLSRYTHKIAISNSRIIRWNQDNVTFSYKDYRDANKLKEMTLSTKEFLRRYLMHILPPAFVKVRFYGFLSNRNKAHTLELIRNLLKQAPIADRFKGKSSIDLLEFLGMICACSNCGSKNFSTRYLKKPLPE